ncbi:flocculation protein FLO11 [Brachypodium distachyon]|uniref:flocculation protein FLO11 n=1 Tax=Brachypodium distachyon TaxID=15368 RepID=UPI000234F7CC|nr:flocculation protein FLO11 [Brachypodium distachyon]|eukprot:XP_003575683.1 flocculation protein FLO11 [Brachypodium distachyon]
MAAADAGTAAAASTDRGGEEGDGESACSTPFVSAPSSPTTRDAPSSSASFPYHGAGGFFSAPTSPTRGKGLGLDFDFDFSSRFPSPSAAAMSSADELFHNGQIRPVPRLSALLLLNPDPLPSMDSSSLDSAEASSGGERERGRVRGGGGGGGGHHRKSRSLSPFSRAGAHWRSRSPAPAPEPEEEAVETTLPLATPAASRSSSSSSTASSASSSSSASSRGSSSRRWWKIKDLLLHRSKSDGGKPNNSSVPQHPSPSAAAPKRSPSPSPSPSPAAAGTRGRAAVNGRRRRTAHERLYEARRAEAEEMRRRTYLPYRQGGLLLFGCIGLGGSHRTGAAAVHGLARAAAVSSRS